MNDICFPGWIKSSPALAMASVLAQLLAEECASSALAVEAALPIGGGATARSGQRAFDEDMSTISGGSGEDGYGEPEPADTPDDASGSEDAAAADAQHSRVACVDTGYLRMVDRLLELNAKELDSLPPAAMAVAATPYARRLSTAPVLRSPASAPVQAATARADILHDARVRTLLRLSRLNDVLTRAEAAQPLISQRTAAAMVAFFAFAVSCRHGGLPAERTKGFFTECSALYATLLSKLRTLRLAAGVSLEDFTASLVACGLKLRDDDEVADGEARSPGMAADGGPSLPFSARSNSSSSAPQAGASSSAAAGAVNGGLGGSRTPTPAALSRDKNLGLVGFGHRALDAVLVRCIPQDIDACAHDAIALGVLRGISLTHSHALVYLGPELVHHMHDLTDAFATSGHRRELAYKRVLSVLLEAISFSRVIDYERTNNWITAIIQETYVVRGLFQREVLHAHVVTATLTLLIRQYQEMAKECAAKVVELGSMPDFTEGDQLIELVWKALQDTIAAWEDAASASEKRPLTLFRHNIEIVVHHLLRTEVERLRCYYIITSATAAYHASLTSLSSPTQASQQWRSPLSQPLGQSLDRRRRGSHAPPAAAAAAAAPYVPSAEEEALRILICGNVVKFLLLPTSIMNALPRTDEADELRASLAEAAAQVLSVVTAREFNSRDGTGARGGNAAAAPPQRSFSLGSAAGLPSAGRGGAGNGHRASTAAGAAAATVDLLAVSRRKAHFSNNFYRCIEDIMHELIQTVLQQHSAAPAAGSGASTDAVANSDSPPSTTATAAAPEAYGDPMLRGMVAAVCLQYMCATNHHLRSFAISEVMDAVVRLSARRGGAEEAAATAAPTPASKPGPRLKAASGDDLNEARRQAEQRRARRLALCFDAMSAILVPAVVDVEAHEHLGSEERAEAVGLSRSGTSTSERGESRREEMARFGQLLCDTYVDALREHLWRAAETRDDKSSRSLLTPVMSVAVKAFVDLVLRVHERLRGMASMALTLVQEFEAAAIVDAPETTTAVSPRSPAVMARDRARLLRAFNAERMSVVLLLRGVIQCMLSVAWPSSGLLYQRATDGGERPLDSTTTSAAMAPTAFAALAPFLRPLTLLLHLSTLFPARSLKQLCTHHQYARYLTLDDPSTSDQYVFHYYRRPSRAYVAVETERHRGAGAVTAEDQMELECWSLFRSCWMMLSYYKYTAEALMAVHDGGLAPRDNTEVSATVTAAAILERDPLLSSAQCKQLRLIAASAAPLLRMCSSDVQQAMADIAVLLRYALAGGRRRPVAAADVAVMNGTVHRQLYKSMKRLCGGKKEDWQRLSTGELMLLQSIAELEVLRAAAGSVAQLTLYRHFEVREFVASAAIPEALGHILVTACEHYIRTVRSLLPAVAFHIVRTDLTQLVMLLSFAIVSVRESASRLALRIAHSFPDYAAHASALPLLWCVLDLLEAGSATQIEAFCDHVRFAAVPAVATDPHSAERRRHVVFVVDVAERWAATLQERAPQALFETAVKFMVIQQQECGERAATPAGGRHAGSRLAVLACQQTRSEASAMSATGGDAATPPLRGAAAAGHLVASEYAQTLLLHGRAQGTMQAAGWYASVTRMQSTVLAELWAATRVSRRALAAAVAQRLESALLRPARAPFAEGGYVAVPLVADPRGGGGNDDAAGASEAEARVTRVALGSLDRAAVAASYAAAVALLVTGNRTPTGRRQLLQYLVQGAVQTFRSDVLCDAILSWKWLLCQDREAYLLPVLQEVDAALVWTAGNRLGLFDGYRASKYRQVQAGDVPLHSGEGAGAEDSGAGEVGVCVADNVDSASPHKLLFSFVADMYVEGGSPLCLSVEVLRQLYVTVAHVMQFHSVFSLRDEMFGETMRCLLVVGSVARLLREANMRRLRAGLVTVVPFSAIGALRQQWYKVLLRWFSKTPPSWYFARDPVLAREEAVVVRALSQLVKEEADLLTRATLGFLDFSSGVHREEEMAVVHHWESLSVVRESVAALRQAADGGEAGLPKLIAQEQQRLLGLLQLLRVLMEHEVLRLSVWQAPRRTRKLPNTTPSAGWDRLIECADYHNPSVVVALVFRFSSISAVRIAASRRVVARPERYANVAEAVDLYLTEEVLRAGAPQLFVFRACTIVQALRLLDPRYTAYKTVTSYAIRSLLSQRSEQLIFYLPQLLQLLATDGSGSIEAFLVRTSARSVMFAHQLLWSLQTEGQGSGALARKCQVLEKRVKAAFTPAEAAFYKAEFAFVDLVTSLSGELMKFEKPQRKAKLRLRLKDDAFHAPPKSQHLYLPTDPEYRITGVIPHTAGAMQSAAKCPILVQFTCVPRAAADTRTPEEMDDDADEPVGATAAALPRPVVKACIFKMGDDCRQDQISLQLIGLMQRILCAVGVPSFLYPYRVVTTGQGSGIIECVPRSRSRNEIGKLVESNVAEYFVQTFGHPESVGFRRARENFVKSTAAYSVVSFILNIKDRHNGNIMIDADGNLVHIDFGFLFDTSPGGDMNFESSPFKLTTEMVQLIGMDVGGDSKLHSKTLARALVDEENYIYFKTLVNRCYLAVRQYAREICVMVELMLHSGLPCFKPKKTVADLAQRLAIDKNEIEAADYMRRRIHESRQNYRTVLYDYYQKVAEGIEM